MATTGFFAGTQPMNEATKLIERVASGRWIGFLRSRGLAGHVVAVDRRFDTGTLALGDGDHHFSDRAGDASGNHATSHPRRGLPHDLTGRRGHLANDDGLHQLTAISESRGRHRELEIGDADALAERCGCGFDLHPWTPSGAQRARRLTGQWQLRIVTEPEAQEAVVELVPSQGEPHLRSANVRGNREDLGDRQPSRRMRVADDDVVHGHHALFAVELLIRRDDPSRQRGRHGEHLDRRARLEHVRQAAVAPGRRLAVSVVVGVVSREARHGEDLPRVRIDHDHAATGSLERTRGRRELALGSELDPLIDRELDVVTRERLLVLNAVGEQKASRTVAQPAQLLDVALELLVHAVLEAVLALAVGRHESEQRSTELAPRVVTLALAFHHQTADPAFTIRAQHADLLGFLGGDLALEPGEAALLEDLLFDGCGIEGQRLGDAIGCVPRHEWDLLGRHVAK